MYELFHLYNYGKLAMKLLSGNLNDYDYEVLQLNIARELMQLRLRPPLVSTITGLNQRYLRRIWKEIHQSSPSRGLTPKSSGRMVRNRDMHDVAVFFAILRVTIKEDPAPELHICHLLSAFHTYQDLFQECNLSFPTCFFLTRDYINGNLNLASCIKCKSDFVCAIGNKYTFHCPSCN